ncbi:hypothetical protein FJV41_16260 [Myxococcus llanfairpwllgwyngyllgogerychwyrndrobwllllantysiliogogogochensis]|uniref:Uncharacterized protein n=1 Tax=Myxococcus llanfairpwllgwyngyllgogerychwyrndrobwllllantysiliogogogochensis TaxID=2590453 RepID=A0A540X0Y7_9BACT|nr:hypothetical protein [Myxococcus llanfairpwllgwyngyllgogerychwyrndrobwllllantysiliogogogochensis]TQF14937.1 hypothetical protein FJV41_16260 [Myxococcus llanfairpwllgwyngyllgogerychwyrndrobwllllantysiliogogogochensis]
MSVRRPSHTEYSNVAVPEKSASGMKVAVPPTHVTLPWVAVPTEVSVSESPSASKSLETSDAPGITRTVSS